MVIRGIVAALVLSCLFSFLLSSLLASFSKKYKIFNNLEDRNLKEKKIPRLGGVAIVMALLLSLLIIRLLFSHLFQNINHSTNYTLLLLAAAIIFLLGIYDDIKGANVWLKFLFQIVSAVIIYGAGFKIAEISIPFTGTKTIGSHLLPFLLTIIWVVGITNAVNIMDGLDGLAIGISFFATLSLGVLAFLSSQYHVVIIVAVLSGAMIGFYPFNFPRARLYLGDSGSMVIGFTLAVLSMTKIHRKASLALALMIPIIILFLPILETSVTIARRIYKKQNVFLRDKDHFHYRFLRKGFSETKTTVFLILVSLLFSLAGILFEFVQVKLRLLLFIGIFLISLFLLIYLGYLNLKPRKGGQPPF